MDSDTSKREEQSLLKVMVILFPIVLLRVIVLPLKVGQYTWHSLAAVQLLVVLKEAVTTQINAKIFIAKKMVAVSTFLKSRRILNFTRCFHLSIASKCKCII